MFINLIAHPYGGLLSLILSAASCTAVTADPMADHVITTSELSNFSGPPIVVKMGVVLSSVSALPYDYYKMGPAIDLAVERSLKDYNIKWDLILSIYDGDCSQTGALGWSNLMKRFIIDLLWKT